MKTASLFTITSIALSSVLMADEPLPQAVEIKPVPKIDICDMPAPASRVMALKGMEANEESIQSILHNEETKTAIEKLNAPIILKSMEEANQHLTRASMEKLAEQVDFEKQQIAIFAWQGSGQDRLRGYLAAGDGAACRFEYTPGMTKDLKPHSSIFVMPKDTHLAVVKNPLQIIRCGVEPMQNIRWWR